MKFKGCLGGPWHRIYQNTSWQRLNKVRMVGESGRAEGQGIRVTGNFQELTAEAAQRNTSDSNKGTGPDPVARPAVLLQVHHSTPTHTCPFLPSCLCTCCPSTPNVLSRPRQAGLTRPHAASSRWLRWPCSSSCLPQLPPPATLHHSQDLQQSPLKFT